jgi:hypothetical protein
VQRLEEKKTALSDGQGWLMGVEPTTSPEDATQDRKKTALLYSQGMGLADIIRIHTTADCETIVLLVKRFLSSLSTPDRR